jgi:TolB-like protein
MLAPLLALALAAPPKLAVLPLSHGEGVPDTTTTALTESLASEVRRTSGADVVTRREIESVLSLEMQKQMLGCQTDACMTELGGALGVDQLVTGDVARLGESWLVHLKVVKPARAQVVAQSDRRIRGGTVDDVLDVLPAMVAELFGAAAPAAAAPAPPPAAPLPAPGAVPAPALRADEPVDVGPARPRLAAFTDGEGHVVAVVPFNRMQGPLLSGDAKRLYQARLVGGGQDGDRAYDLVFWDPRYPRGAERSFSFREGKAVLSCGSREIPLRMVPLRQARQLAGKAKVMQPPWRRYPHALARDDDGNYFLLDGARGPDGGALEGKGWALWVGPRSAMAPVEVREVLRDEAGLLALTPAGKLKVGRDSEGRTRAEWMTSSGSRALTWLEPSDHGPALYGELSPYAGQPLGTPCDPYAGK